MLTGLLILLAYQAFGELFVTLTALPIPGPVIGMLLLLLTLIFKNGLLAKVQPTAEIFVRNLTLLFFPAGIGIAMKYSLFGDALWLSILAIVTSTLITLLLVALLLKLLLKKKPAKR